MAVTENREPVNNYKTIILVVVGLVILIAPILLYFLFMKESYEPLLSNINESRAAILADELGRQGIDYRYIAESQTVEVNTQQIHQARMALVSNGDIGSAATGFELFDEAGYGMTGFTQKVNFQRALQGELERTITNFEGIRMARVHLVLPEQSLFRDQQGEASASVVLMLKPGFQPDTRQVASIQQLVAAAVPSLNPDGIVISNSTGQVLSTPGGESAEMTGQLGYKQAVEQYYTNKLTTLAEQALGAGQVAVVVDAKIDFTQYSTQRENPLTQADGTATLLKSRTVTEFESATGKDGKSKPGIIKESIEQDFQAGKELVRMEQQPGVIETLHVSVLVNAPITADEQSALDSLIRSAAGLDGQRGDTLALSVLSPKIQMPVPVESPVVAPVMIHKSEEPLQGKTTSMWAGERTGMHYLLIGGAVLILMLGIVVAIRMQSRRLPKAERELLLADMQDWLTTEDVRYAVRQ
ncbi:flagellar basal-body MS-ring/collar protein FliF [Parendozoicomonas haliclonae]|uniref:Flagellar M-ring protein n=1 Tax=Parendozoicomonas haliclonae TaxID=1960125 RepID=A0A1X7AP30_9GAMM|nr:flagellar basal-body MS-ring/collar protein FliF [Parendozoicomonas haliclonae]SMA49882.1 Flagellar M-ring protein [Parendozoicomonas haliclonae]